MRSMLTRSAQAMACAAALVTLAACGGDADGEKTSASSSSTSSAPTYDDAYAYTEAKKIEPKQRAHDLNKPLPEDTEWATPKFVQSFNKEMSTIKNAGAVQKGHIKATATYPAESDPDAPGGWDLTMYQCSTSTVRLYKDGKDVSGTPGNPSTPLPMGPQMNVHLKSYTTPDQGKTWQLDKSQYLSGKDAKESPCGKK